MNNQKRIEEVAQALCSIVLCAPSDFYTQRFRGFLAALPEFQFPPKSEWLEFTGLGGNGFDNHTAYLLLLSEGGVVLGSLQTHGGAKIKAFMPIPLYVPPESELVRRFAVEWKEHGHGGYSDPVALLNKVEKELENERKTS